MSLSDSIYLISKDDKQHTAGDDSVDIHIFNSLCNKNNYTSLFKELNDIEKVNRNQTFRNAQQHVQYRKRSVLHDRTQLISFQSFFGGTRSESALDGYACYQPKLHFSRCIINVNVIKIHFQSIGLIIELYISNFMFNKVFGTENLTLDFSSGMYRVSLVVNQHIAQHPPGPFCTSHNHYP